MAKKCASAAILETLRDPRVVTMNAAAQMVWIRAVTAMQNSGISVFKFGSDIMNRTGIALFIQIAETEIETHLQTIVDRGLLEIGADGAISCPMLAAAATRAEINRINGKKGGRPRKDASPPAQREMLLPINGGGGKTEITESETEMATETENSPTYLLKESVEVVSGKVPAEADFAAVGQAAFDAAGFDPAKSFANFGIVRDWLRKGADKKLIVDVITRKTHAKVTTLKYFDAAICEAILAKPKAKPDWERAYDRAMSNWELVGRGLDPMPRIEDFRERDVA